MYKDAILVRGAKVHNLKNIDIDIPLGKIVAIAGVSGSGKSSLALGVLYAEGSRRYLEALSTYTRRRINQSEKANVESVQYVPAALALHQRPNIPSVRSTFGTSTELLNSLRLLYSRCGNYLCPNGHRLAPSLNVAREIELECEICGERFFGLGSEEYAFNSDGACPYCSGTGIERVIDDSTLVPDENRTLEEGAVESWNMFGISWMYNVAGELGVRLNVPFKNLNEREKDIVYNGPTVKKYVNIPSKNGKLFEVNAEYRNAHKAVEEALKNAKTEKGLARINKYLRLRECEHCHGTRLNERANSTLLGGINISRACNMTLEDIVKWIPDVINGLPGEMREMADNIKEEFMDNARILLDLGLGYISLDRPSNTLSTGELQRVQLARTLRNPTTGVLYVLDEPSIGLHPSNVDGLISVMNRLIEDGNSIILVDHDVRILKVADYMIELGPYAGKKGGNILASGKIEEVMENNNSIISGFLSNEEDIVIRKKSDKESLFEKGSIELSTSEIHNVKDMDVCIPKGKLTVVSGVSGSGKTTLLLESLYPGIKSIINDENLPDHIKNIAIGDIGKIELIDSVPIGKNVRSTVSTYSSILDDLRKVYAKLDISMEKGLKVSDFSYNTGSLRCPTCNGTGNISMDVQFLPDVEIICPDCNGLRYGDESDEIRLNDLSIKDFMALTIDEAISEVSNISELDLLSMDNDSQSISKDELKAITSLLNRILVKLGKLSSLGLGYLSLGEATPSLSGGEAQRLKLASEIGKSQKNSVFIFDEPSIGLHPLDVRVLLNVFQTLIDDGATVIVIEHDLDIISNADYIIDIGIDDNHMGGEILAEGILEDILDSKDSLTARYLKEINQNF